MKESLDVLERIIEAKGIMYSIVAKPAGDERETYYVVEIAGPSYADTVEMRLNPDTCEFDITDKELAEEYSELEPKISRLIINHNL